MVSEQVAGPVRSLSVSGGVERNEEDRAELVKQTDGNVKAAISCPGASPDSRRSVGGRIPSPRQ